MRCHPECVPLPGKPWCAEHQERLDKVRVALAEERRRASWHSKEHI